MCASVCPSLCPSDGHHHLSKCRPVACYITVSSSQCPCVCPRRRFSCMYSQSPFLREQKRRFYQILNWKKTPKSQPFNQGQWLQSPKDTQITPIPKEKKKLSEEKMKNKDTWTLWKTRKYKRQLDRTKCGTGQRETADSQWWWEKTRQGYAD